MSHDDGKRGYQEDSNARLTPKGEIPQSPETSRVNSERNAAGHDFKAKLRQTGQQHRQKLHELSRDR